MNSKDYQHPRTTRSQGFKNAKEINIPETTQSNLKAGKLRGFKTSCNTQPQNRKSEVVLEGGDRQGEGAADFAGFVSLSVKCVKLHSCLKFRKSVSILLIDVH